MPIRNRIKEYKSGGIYHIYNRGIDGREVFGGDDDLDYFRLLLKTYLDDYREEVTGRYKERPYIRKRKQAMNLKGQIDLLAYCLMPDHLHLLIRQYAADGITKLMRRLMTNYVMYFNRKYKRKGVLFENVYRAVLLPDERMVLELSRYIHLNPVAMAVKRYGLVETITSSSPEYYMYSSYQNYLGEKQEGWLKPEYVLEIFSQQQESKNLSYRQFVESAKRQADKGLASWILE
jgi:REP-associated tyrosine transposase